MIEKHYGRYNKSDSAEQLKRVFDRQAGTFAGTQQTKATSERTEVVKRVKEKKWSGRVDLNHRLHGPEPCALPS
jgi:FKBP-type peptidyl-prolyl cis-trans isomerase 2